MPSPRAGNPVRHHPCRARTAAASSGRAGPGETATAALLAAAVCRTVPADCSPGGGTGIRQKGAV